MYQVIKLYGDFEPWWLLEGWQEDIVTCEVFEDYIQAKAFYQTEWQSLSQRFPKVENKSDKMSVFWDPEEQRWCDECDEFLQQYHSLFILEISELPSAGEYSNQSFQRIKMCHLKKIEEC